jgi:hypothetical protein
VAVTSSKDLSPVIGAARAAVDALLADPRLDVVRTDPHEERPSRLG